MRNYAPENLTRVRDLRKGATRSERRLWYDGLALERLGFRFRRQYPFGPYVLDFYCVEAKVCVEVDGASHEERVDQDAARDAYLARHGVETLRFGVCEVMEYLDSVLGRILEACVARTSSELGTPTLPSPCEQGEAFAPAAPELGGFE